jgi:hypothetical protein
MIKFFRKSHTWLGIFLTLFLLMFAASGVVLNHRKFFSRVDLNRKWMPLDHRYVQWNNASIRGSLEVGADSVLIFGNIGIWLTTSDFLDFEDFNKGFRPGIDNRKVSALCRLPDGELFAGTYFGLFRLDPLTDSWTECELPVREKRVSDLSLKGDSLLILTRSELLIRDPRGNIYIHHLPAPEGYNEKVGLFKTLWVVHSGEIYGLAGKIIVDAVGLIVVFLTFTGLVFFVNRHRIRGRKRKGKEAKKIAGISKWNLKWHNKIGWITLILLLLTTITGMFLRPPLLITIARKDVRKIPGTKLDTPSAWYDKLRAIRWDEASRSYLVASNEGLYRADEGLEDELYRFPAQPPLSVMGINVFEPLAGGYWLVGSFSGLYVWNPEKEHVVNRVTMEPWAPTRRPGPPVSRHLVSGMSGDYKDGMVWFDYSRGAQMMDEGKGFPEMPQFLRNTPISLWNAALEVHTGRIYKPLFGNFYILVVPLVGLLTVFMSIAGFVVWYKRHRRRKKG